ncbi:unnamed protein product [Cuscuta campestris]|uniref:CCHC-type domain-containing protein n=1 Tax=Cuscuta campestris TaxID=132261 RepID=A0A484K3Y3_9ASTE|nr:unnamed protein product [Cuscuta campestris]
MKKVGDKLIPKTEDEFDAEDIKKVEYYAKAVNMLYCAVNPDDYCKISGCSTAKEMLDKLEVTYEGTDQVREAKIDFLTQEYEMFRMKEHEKIDDMFDRFSKIVNDLHALKKTYTDRDLVRKILRSLTSEWRSKADAIYESIGTSNVTIDSLRDEVKLIMKKFCKLIKKEKAEDGPVCYRCGEAGHIKNKCPKSGRNARHFKRQMAYISWGGDSGDESSEQEEDEEANLCLIAQEEEESANGENQEVCLSLEDKRKLSMNAKAINILHCSLGLDEFARVSTCKTAKEVWDLLEATHEGDVSTKQTMIALGHSEYESFKKVPCETIQDMNKRFNKIVNKLSKLGKTYTTSELNTKILFSLPKEWHSSIVDLLPKCDKAETAHIWSSLYSHELLLRKIKEEEVREKPKLTNAFKASKESSSEESSESSDDSSNSSSTEESNDEEDEEKAMRMKYTDFLKWKKYVNWKEVYSKPKKERHKPRKNKNPLRFGTQE